MAAFIFLWQQKLGMVLLALLKARKASAWRFV
jgi:hypothetical protein